MLEGFGPLGFSVVGCFNGEGMVKMGSDGNVPRITGQHARTKTAGVINEINYDPFKDLDGKASDRGWVCRSCLWGGAPELRFPDCGQGVIPRSLDERLDCCSGNCGQRSDSNLATRLPENLNVGALVADVALASNSRKTRCGQRVRTRCSFWQRV